MTKPFLKWAGGKAGLIEQIDPLMPDMRGRTLHEPFLGGGALFFHYSEQIEKAYLGDTNSKLISTYLSVKDVFSHKDLASRLRKLQKQYDEVAADSASAKALYAQIRESYNAAMMSLSERAALFIFLNKTCFNGLHRVNKKGEFNVPFGKYKKPAIFDSKTLKAAQGSLAKATLLCEHFRQVTCRAEEGDVVYLDPPYIPVSKSSNFTSYAQEGFGPDDQKELRTVFEELDRRGCHVILSNSDTPKIRKLYKGYSVKKIKAPRSINSKGDKRGNVGEVLIRNWS